MPKSQRPSSSIGYCSWALPTTCSPESKNTQQKDHYLVIYSPSLVELNIGDLTISNTSLKPGRFQPGTLPLRGNLEILEKRQLRGDMIKVYKIMRGLEKAEREKLFSFC